MALTSLRMYLSKAFRWQRGRQGTGYDKMLLLTAPWPLPFDSYIIRYPDGAEIPPHTDPVQNGRHYRLNLILKSPRSGGDFICATPIYSSKKSSYFARTPANTASPALLAEVVMYCRSVGCWVG